MSRIMIKIIGCESKTTTVKSSLQLTSRHFPYIICSIILFIVVLLSSPVFATEGGGSAYAAGTEDFMMGALPPPGTYFLNYSNYTNLDCIRDNSGDKVPVDFDGYVTFNAFRLLHVSNKKILGGNWATHVVVPFISAHVEMGGLSQSKSGLGDITVNPCAITWHWKNFHCVAGVDIIMPTGAYDEDDMVNIGRNAWTFSPLYAFTYLHDSGFEVSAKLMYLINTENNDTSYESGQEFIVDYVIAKHFRALKVGVNGSFYQQTTDDYSHGEKVDNYKGRVFSLGPAVQYSYKNMLFTAKYQVDTLVKNKTESQKFWFVFVYAF